MLNVFIGVDRSELVSFYVLAHSIMSKATCPISITPLYRDNLPFFTRKRIASESTDFSITRFLVPYLSGYQGWSLYLDCDILCRVDLAELTSYMTLRDRWSKAVLVVKHDYIPKGQTKFLNHTQAVYGKKNWSSVMVFNNAECLKLTPEFVHSSPGMALHQFDWTYQDKIGTLPRPWNYLVGEDNQCDTELAKLVHFTNGSPCFPEYQSCEFADEWFRTLGELISPFGSKIVAGIEPRFLHSVK